MAVSLSINSASAGYPFEATLLGRVAGDRIEIRPAPSGFYFLNGKVRRPRMPLGILSGVIRQTLADGTANDVPFDVTGTLTSPLDELNPNVPVLITAAGQVSLNLRAGATVSLASNPYGAWSVVGNVLSWSASAINTRDRPRLVETFVGSDGETSLESMIAPGGSVGTDIPANALYLNGAPLLLNGAQLVIGA